MIESLLGNSPASELKADISEHCRFHLQQVVKCEWGQAGKLPVFIREEAGWAKWSRPIRGECWVRSGRSQRGHVVMVGGVISLYEPLESVT
jgi:hypothetical protein